MCHRGHPMSGDNLYTSPKNVRMCKACAKLRRNAKPAGTRIEPVSTVGRTCPQGHVVAGDNLVRYGNRNVCVACRNASFGRARKKLREEAIKAYGGKCNCCGENTPVFLTIDHVNNNGAEHRKEVPAGSTFHRWLKSNGYPKDFQILCWNCNSGRHLNGGICPHSELS